MDENIPLVTVSELRSLQHDVLDIRHTPDQGLSDDLLWELVMRQERLLITTEVPISSGYSVNKLVWSITIDSDSNTLKAT